MENAILYLLIYVVEGFILYWYSSTLFESSKTRTFKFLFFSLLYTILYAVSFAKIIWLNNLLFTLATILIFITIYNIKWIIAIFYALIISCVMALSEIVIAGFSTNFNADTIIHNQGFNYLIILTVASKMLYLLVLKIIMSFIPKKFKKSESNNRATTLLTIISFISLYIVISLTIFFLQVKMSVTSGYILSSCAILLLINNILYFSIYQFIQRKNQEFTDMQVSLQKEYDMNIYYKTVFTQNENQRILIHDIRKHLTTISNLNNNHGSTTIKKYLDTLLSSSALQETVQVSDNIILNSILCHYISLCRNRGIYMKVDIRKNSLTFFDYTDLTALFGNILDNAIEACAKNPNAFIELSVSHKPYTKYTIISLINTCIQSPQFNNCSHLISNKIDKYNHGFGIKSIERITKKYNGNLKMYYEEENHLFHTIIMVCSE